ncbi:probable transmembrane protein [Aquitalea magnusonii]|uniref:Probable transmembrane protein n=1 Tax=Aquitalea magnusonii TaxID=332411 RepID=A0A3G9GN94_9NEIS|nr:YeeE/YedE family protein [Aquitalea magnusonii]BBF87361.1 probable transmembrane protein [Aquitalea magnusonii]
MQIDWAGFTPAAALAGGMLIGLAASWLVLMNGRIAGISGMVGGLLDRAGDWPLRLAFVLGLLLAPALWWLCIGNLPRVQLDVSPLRLLLAGVLVGIGTRLASGCTSGHGVCGLSRLSPRSLLATLSFMLSAALTVYIVRHCLGWA